MNEWLECRGNNEECTVWMSVRVPDGWKGVCLWLVSDERRG